MASLGNIVLSYHDSLLRESDIRLLDVPNWINDNLISFWFEYLEKDKYKDLKDKIAFVNPQLTQFIKLASKEEGKLMMEPLQLAEKELILLAVNDCLFEESAGGSHWSLLVYNRGSGFEHFDSFNGSGNPAHAKKVAEIVYELVIGKAEKKKTLSVAEKKCLQQRNGYDCGIHVMCNVDRICQNFAIGDTANVYLNSQNFASEILKARSDFKDLIHSLSRSIV